MTATAKLSRTRPRKLHCLLIDLIQSWFCFVITNFEVQCCSAPGPTHATPPTVSRAVSGALKMSLETIDCSQCLTKWKTQRATMGFGEVRSRRRQKVDGHAARDTLELQSNPDPCPCGRRAGRTGSRAGRTLVGGKVSECVS